MEFHENSPCDPTLKLHLPPAFPHKGKDRSGEPW